jgi:hypothetical protein
VGNYLTSDGQYGDWPPVVGVGEVTFLGQDGEFAAGPLLVVDIGCPEVGDAVIEGLEGTVLCRVRGVVWPGSQAVLRGPKFRGRV